MKWKGVLLASAAGLMLSLAAAQPARADHRDDQRKCFDRLQKEEHKLQRDVRKHGWNSRQAQQRRIKLNRMRSQCGGNFWGNGRNDRRDDGWFGRDRRDRDRDWRDDRRRRDDRNRNSRDFWDIYRNRRR